MGDYKFKWYGTNRTLCDALEDMRNCSKTKNYTPLDGLIEEIQVIGNRMESALADQRDLLDLRKEYSKAKKAYKKLEKEYTFLKAKKDKLSKSK